MVQERPTNTDYYCKGMNVYVYKHFQTMTYQICPSTKDLSREETEWNDFLDLLHRSKFNKFKFKINESGIKHGCNDFHVCLEKSLI